MQMTSHNPAQAIAFMRYAKRAAPAAYKAAMRRLGFGCASCGLGNSTVSDANGNIVTLDDAGNVINVTDTAGGLTVPAGSASAQVATDQGIFGQFMTSLTTLAPSLVNAYNSNNCTQVNIARAKAGQPMIDCSQIAPTATVGLTSGTTSLIMVGILALAGVAIFKAMKRR